MKYRIITLLSLLLLLAGNMSANELRVAPGETLVITEGQQALELDLLVLGDAASVRFAPGLKRWQVTAKEVRVGNNVQIDASGAAGSVGKPASEYTSVAETCEDGKAGIAGGKGNDGGNGVELALSWGIAELGSLRLVSDGGAGGSGGAGGRGQNGGELNKCRGGNGGAGGAGGDGGNGGDAGNISLVYWPVGDKLDMTAVAQRVSASSAAGKAGLGGVGGEGGAAEDGRYMKGSFGGNKKWLAGGEKGQPGAAGEAGKPGSALVPQLQQDFAKAQLGRGQRAVPEGLPVKKNKATVALSQRVQELETQLEALENRLLKLEQLSR